VVPENIHTAPPLPRSSGNYSLASYFPLKILAFRPPTPLEFPVTIHGQGMDIFWNHTFNLS